MQTRVSREQARRTIDRVDAILARHAAHAFKQERETVVEISGVSVHKGRHWNGDAYVTLEIAGHLLFAQHESGDRYQHPTAATFAQRFQEAN